MKNFTYITEQAKEVRHSWTNGQKLAFHYFSKNGLVHARRAQCAEIAELVDSGVVKSGWHLAYGTFADHQEKHLIDLAGNALAGKRIGSIKTRVAIELLSEQLQKVENKIAEVKLSNAAE